MKLVSLFDTSVATTNIGDQIIMESVENILMELLHHSFFFKIQTHDAISNHSYNLIRKCDLKFVGGTNLLTSNMDVNNPWKIGIPDTEYLQNIILMGVGWFRYQEEPNKYTSQLYNKILSKTYLHSVRDSYSANQLRSIGITNVVNTACPTMWCLNARHCSKIPQEKSKKVLLTFTNDAYEYDKKIYTLLRQHYETIYFWPQQPHNYEYMKSIGGNNVIYLNPNLNSFDKLLSSQEVDYIGTRLHAGIRALQHKKRTLILSIDNRAKEIAKDTNLPVIDRKEINAINDWINHKFFTKINLPEENIVKWKKQFTMG